MHLMLRIDWKEIILGLDNITVVVQSRYNQ